MPCAVVAALEKYRPDLQDVMSSVARNSQRESVPFLKEHDLWNSYSTRLYNQMREGHPNHLYTEKELCFMLAQHTVRLIKQSRI